MADFKPNTPYNVPFFLMVPEEKKVKGVITKTFTKIEEPFYCSFRTFGGTERTVNDAIVVENTAVIETWYDPRIKADCVIEVDGLRYEILGTPENISMRNQFLLFKVKAIKGGA